MAEKDDKTAEMQAQLKAALDKLEDATKRVTLLEENNRALLAEKKKAKEEADAANAAAAAEVARKSGDVAAIEKSWQEKLNAAVTERDKHIADLTGVVNSLSIGSEATRLASKLALPESADVLLPHIKARLSAELKDGSAHVRVLGLDGKPTAMTLADLEKEIVGNKAFAPILVGSKGNGAGGTNSGGGGGKVSTVSRAQWDAMDHAQRMEHSKAGGKVA
jgi:hypothetical protein